MTRQIRNAVFATLGVSVLAITAATFASARTSPHPVDETMISAADDDRVEARLAPTGGAPLITGTASGACLSDQQMVATLDADKQRLGGQMVMLSDGLEQAFSDAWRREIDTRSVKVSNVIAHLLPTTDGGSLVDVVEFDASGCALSRTIMSGDDWSQLLAEAAGREA